MTIFNKSVTASCAPAAGTPSTPRRNSRIWTPAQPGVGVAGPEGRALCCVLERHLDEYGNFGGETPYPVVGDVQTDPAVAARLRRLEWRSVVTVDGTAGLIYRKEPSPNGFRNSWLSSAQTAVQSWVGSWGEIIADRNAGEYRFVPLNLQGRPIPDIPDVDELINELLAEYVVDRRDHPVLERLLTPADSHAARAGDNIGQTGEEDADGNY